MNAKKFLYLFFLFFGGTALGADPAVLSATQKGLALIVAADKGDKEKAEYYIGAGADLNIQNTSGKTALNAAASTGWTRPEIIRLLLEAGADMNITNRAGEKAINLVNPAEGKEGADAYSLLSQWESKP